MCDEDLPAIHDIRERDAAVISPLLQDLNIIDEDNKVLRLALVKDFGGGIVSTRHIGIGIGIGIGIKY